MKAFHIPRGVLLLVLFVLVVFAVLYRPIGLKALVRASSQCTVRTEEIVSFGRDDHMQYHLFSPDDAEYQQVTEVLSQVTCRKKLNQLYSSYSHEYPMQSVTVSGYDDAENHKFLLTVYSDGVCIVNNAFVSVKRRSERAVSGTGGNRGVTLSVACGDSSPERGSFFASE